MEIQYMSRANAISYCKEAHLAKTAIISISTPNREYTEAPFATTANGVQDILFLSFADIDGGDAPVRNIHGGEEPDIMHPCDGYKIRRFVRKNRNVDEIIVHCDEGKSRSAGIAAALAEYYCDDATIRHTKGVYPNMRCYLTTMRCLKASPWKAFLDK